jgi:Protein of unknown function (DUF3800)
MNVNMASYTAYFDESGHETTPFFTFGGLVLDAERANAFENNWKKAIDPLGELHTSQFMVGKDGYEEWNDQGLEWKQKLLARAASVIAEYSYQTFAMTLGMSDFDAISTEQNFDRAVAHPYALGTRFAAVQVGHWSKANSINNRVPMVFERREGRNIEETIRVFNRDHLDIPTFEEKGAAALQAADLIAAIYGQRNTKSVNFFKYRPAYAGLNQMLHTNDNLGRAALQSIWNRVRPLIEERPAPPGERPGIYFESDLSRPRKAYC